MIGRRTAALLCVLLVHALVIYSLMQFRSGQPRATSFDSFVSEPITLYLTPLAEETPRTEPAATAAPASAPTRERRVPTSAATPATAPASGESSAIAPPGRVDWPIEGRKSVARVLAAEAEAERVAKMFAGPDGTWASLTKRQRSQINKFKWKPGIDGLEYDEKGNAIYRLPNGCAIVNFMFFGCPIGKNKVHGDMLDNMRLYFDEQRLPQTNEGNGTEPEALRPAN